MPSIILAIYLSSHGPPQQRSQMACLVWSHLQVLYLRRVKMAGSETLSDPAAFGLSPFKTFNVRLNTVDRERLGSWHVLPDSLVSMDGSVSEREIDNTFKTHPTVIFAHGNAATRAMSGRVATAAVMSNKLDANVISFDYRGFGDSSGLPSEKGLTLDAQAAYDYAISRGATPDKIILLGQSLGTGVVTNFARKLSSQGIEIRAVVLAAPFSSVTKLLETYKIGGLFPLFSPLRSLPQIREYLFTFLRHKYDTGDNLHAISSPVLIAHSVDDIEIPVEHSISLFKSQVSNNKTKSHEITSLTGHKWGVLEYTDASAQRGLLLTQKGGHNAVVWSEGLAETMLMFMSNSGHAYDAHY
ncbi:hypothetical protein E3P92_03340 [Wallemia ichthyophaga]|nr:hypothetical protein E3P92_03340 [Wallemia ichthyophaga]TIB30071.1 hypothetical protein E3P84_03468 [Wallemia ichthyophaga]TIB39645.1 hypothetical protein E3P83_03368 [Wallemia ichthyophaga]